VLRLNPTAAEQRRKRGVATPHPPTVDSSL
jgi:hypothetical protein